MELFKLCFTLVSLTLPTFVTKSHADNFTKNCATAFKKIQAVKTTIDYNTFCKEMAGGGQEKIVCCIKAVPTIGFLVCRRPENCLQEITTEVNNLLILSRDGIETVKIAPRSDMRIIQGVKCGSEKSVSCSGFLEEWVPHGTGRFKHIRDRIVKRQVPDLIAEVKRFTRGDSQLKKSAGDLNNIMNYMQTKDKFRQICDLQGFFLVEGGFRVADVPQIKENMSAKDPCWEGEPTTTEVYDALMQMRDAFKKP